VAGGELGLCGEKIWRHVNSSKSYFQKFMIVNKLLFFIGMCWLTAAKAQNVGIGNPAPSEKLDVSGNINLTGSIKANGVDGNPNQVLMKNNSGALAWGDLCDFKKMVTFIDTSVTSTPWLVPSGVTRIWVEMWGAGGAGIEAGGGGGAYVTFFKDVTAGNILSVEAGKGGKDNPFISGSGETGQSGGYSRVSSTLPAINVFAGGGTGSVKNTVFAYPQQLQGVGGRYFTSSTGITEFFTFPGQTGSSPVISYFLLPANQYNRVSHYGRGGDAGNVPNSGAEGGVLVENINGAVTSTVMVSPPWQGNGGFPGGGGGGMPTNTLNSSRSGANGMVIIHY
jgi:hypothetical protein